MDLKGKMCLFALTILGALAMVSAQVDCYQCSYTYSDDDTDEDNDCKNPSAATTSNVTCPTSHSCYVETSFSLTSFPGYMTYQRGCGLSTACHAECTKGPRTCRKCCSTNLCNSATLKDHLRDNKLTQSCYRCQFSEVLGTRSDAGCQLDFDATSSRVYKADCPGLCFSAKAKFEHVEDVIRGCSYHGDYCSYAGTDNGNVFQVRDSVSYDVACCNGENCNTATALSVGRVTVLLSLSAAVTLYYN